MRPSANGTRPVAAGRATQILNCLPDGSPLVYFEYGYDAASRINSVRREDGNMIYYGYDPADRLTSEEWYDAEMAPLYCFQWDYDAAGNRTYEKRGETETYYTYDAANELLHTRHLPDDAWSYFQYDPMGNTTAIQEPDGTTYFAYNGAGLVSSIAYKTGVANYFYYDAELRRYAIEESTELRYFTWDENGMNLLCERDAGGATVAQYAHGHTPVDGIGSMAAARKADGESTYYQYPIYDHRGTVLRLTDDNATVTATYEYDAWGNALQAEDPPAGNRFRYQSNWVMLADSQAALTLPPRRLYQSRNGIFLQRDRVASVGPMGGYLYAAAAPLRFVDPDGLKLQGDTSRPRKVDKGEYFSDPCRPPKMWQIGNTHVTMSRPVFSCTQCEEGGGECHHIDVSFSGKWDTWVVHICSEVLHHSHPNMLHAVEQWNVWGPPYIWSVEELQKRAINHEKEHIRITREFHDQVQHLLDVLDVWATVCDDCCDELGGVAQAEWEMRLAEMMFQNHLVEFAYEEIASIHPNDPIRVPKWWAGFMDLIVDRDEKREAHTNALRKHMECRTSGGVPTGGVGTRALPAG